MAFDSILVSTGFPYGTYYNTIYNTRTTEIINIDNGGLTCKDLGEYPLQIQGAVGGNMGSGPFICGGSNVSTIFNQCYRLNGKPFNLVHGFVV